MKEMKQSLNHRVEQLYEIDGVLFTNQDVPKLTNIEKVTAIKREKSLKSKKTSSDAAFLTLQTMDSTIVGGGSDVVTEH